MINNVKIIKKYKSLGLFECAQSETTAPFSLERPISNFDYTAKLAGNTYTGLAMKTGTDLTDINDFIILGSGACSNTITFAAEQKRAGF